MVLVADMQTQKKVYFSLGGHTSRVNSVQWLHNDIVAVSDRIVVYEGKGTVGSQWKIKQTIQGKE
jgi:hypothetical protein